jgi:hypothetical protein
MRYTAPPDTAMLSVRIPRALMERLQQYARQHRLSITDLVRDGVEWRLDQEHVPGRGGPTPPEAEAPELLAMLERMQRDLQRLTATLPAPAVDTPVPARLAIQKAYTPTTAPAGSVRQNAGTTVLTPDAPLYDEAKYHLGVLCKAGHAYGTTGQTMRRIGSNACRECEVERQHKSRAKKRAQVG